MTEEYNESTFLGYQTCLFCFGRSWSYACFNKEWSFSLQVLMEIMKQGELFCHATLTALSTFTVRAMVSKMSTVCTNL